MPDCVFCKIAGKEIPAEIVYEDDEFVAFLDVNPHAPGHVQIVPKKHFRWVWQVPAIGRYFEVVRRIALALQKAFRQEAVWSKIMGDEIKHAHVWVFPHPLTPGDKNDLRTNAEKIKEALKD